MSKNCPNQEGNECQRSYNKSSYGNNNSYGGKSNSVGDTLQIESKPVATEEEVDY